MPIKPPVRQFIFAALSFLLIGLLSGILMLDRLARGEPTYRLVWPHVHLLLAGFVLSLIYGIGYQLIPAFFGKRLVNQRLAWVHLTLHVAGVVQMVLGVYLARGETIELVFYRFASIGGTMVVAGGMLFVYNLATIQSPVIQLRKQT